MRIEREELVLYSLVQTLGPEFNNNRYTKKQLSNALGITSNTLNQYLLTLKKRGFIQRRKRKYQDELSKLITVTNEGKMEADRIESVVNDFLLTPERHNLAVCIKISEILENIRDPLERIFFLSLYNKYKEFDLPLLLDTFRTAKMDTNLVNVFSRMDIQEEDNNQGSFIETFFNSCFYGEENRILKNIDSWKCGDVNTLLIVAEASQKQGRLSESRMIYEHILDTSMRIDQHQWFQANMGLAISLYREGMVEDSISLLERLIEESDDKLCNAIARERMATIYQNVGRPEMSIPLYRSCIAAFTSHGIPILNSIALNNRGVLNFRRGDIDQAEKDWKKARKFSKKSNSKYQEAKILPNLADIVMKKGDFDLSTKYLDKAEEIFEDYGDQVGLADVEFNRSLQKIEEKDPDSAIGHFKRAEKKALPTLSPSEIMERREVFLSRAMENGLEGIEQDDFDDLKFICN